MTNVVVTCMRLSKPCTASMTNYFINPSTQIRRMCDLQDRVISDVNQLEVTGTCSEVIDVLRQYRRKLEVFAESPASRQLRTTAPLQFDWTPLFSEDEHCTDRESSTCIWFEIAMCYVLLGQLYYSLGVEELVEYEANAGEEHLKNSAAQFRYAAYMFLQARHYVNSYWKTTRQEFDPTVRDNQFVQLWEKLCLAAAQHCFVTRYRDMMKAAEGEHRNVDKMRATLSKLLMGEASLYEDVLRTMQKEDMCSSLTTLALQVGELYENAISSAYQHHMDTIDTGEDNIWFKIAAYENLLQVLDKRVPDRPHTAVQEQLRKLNVYINSVYFIRRGDTTVVPRHMIPVSSVNVKAEQPHEETQVF